MEQSKKKSTDHDMKVETKINKRTDLWVEIIDSKFKVNKYEALYKAIVKTGSRKEKRKYLKKVNEMETYTGRCSGLATYYAMNSQQKQRYQERKKNEAAIVKTGSRKVNEMESPWYSGLGRPYAMDIQRKWKKKKRTQKICYERYQERKKNEALYKSIVKTGSEEEGRTFLNRIYEQQSLENPFRSYESFHTAYLERHSKTTRWSHISYLKRVLWDRKLGASYFPILPQNAPVVDNPHARPTNAVTQAL